MAGRRTLRTLGALLTAAALLAASCGGDESTTGAPAAQMTVSIDLKPDPIWEWIESSGHLSEWRQIHNTRLEVTNSFDQFAAFTSGHADIVVINALDVGKFVEQSDRDPVIIGKLTTDRSILAVSRSMRTATTLEDLVDGRIAVESSLGSTLLWGLIADTLHDLDFRVSGADFDLVVVDSASVADLVIRGDVDACICSPDIGASYLADGRLRTLYDGRPAAKIYAADVLEDPDELPMELVFVVDEHWLESNLMSVEHIFELWDSGIQEWESNRAQIVSDFRHLFSVQSDEEVDWITRYLRDHNWRTPSARLEESDVGTYAEIYFRMKRAGLIPEDAYEPEIRILDTHEHEEEHDEEELGAEEFGAEERAA